MKRSELLVTFALSLVLGIGVLIGLNGSSLFTLSQSIIEEAVATSPSATPTSRSIPTRVSPTTTSLSRSISTRVSPTATPTLVPLQVGTKKGEDLESVLLLYDSTRVSTFDINFCKIAEYYGLKCKKIALDTSALTEDLLRDSQGNFFKLVGISAGTLLADQPLLENDQTALIKSAVETGGANLFVAKVHSQLNPNLLTVLTDGAIVGVTKPQDSTFRDWSISTAAPEITREFTGQVIYYTVSPKYEFSLTLGRQQFVTTLITSTNEAETYPIFVRCQKGSGSIFIDAGENAKSLETTQLRSMFGQWDFSQIVPLMMTVRYALGDRAWHTDHHYANLTIDDPTLVEPYGELSFVGLLKEMREHNFHTTIAFVPARGASSTPEVVSLFRANPDRYSLVQHGNNHDGYEFYKYNLAENDPKNDPHFRARPLDEQEADIVEGLQRMEKLGYTLGIPVDQVMVFPYGISPEQTLVSLKKYNYLATVNAQDIPLDATRPPTWDYDMYQANMDYGGFPTLTRRQPGTDEPIRPVVEPFILDLFIGKPALFYAHAYEKDLFSYGIDAFNPVADRINSLSNGVEWRSLGYIVKHLYLERTNSDGSIDIKMYGNDLTITPGGQGGMTYHIVKEETLNVPIQRLTVNGHDFPYRIEENLLKLDLVAPKDGSPIEIVIRYAGGK